MKLLELNPRYTGKATWKITGEVVTQVSLPSQRLTDL